VKQDAYAPWSQRDIAFALSHNGVPKDRATTTRFARYLNQRPDGWQPDYGAKEIGAGLHPPRSAKATKHWYARNRLRITRIQTAREPRPAVVERHHKRYSEEEEWVIESGELQKFGGSRTESAIYFKRWRMGLCLRQSGEWMSIEETAQMYGRTRNQIRWRIRKGDLPVKRINTRVVMIDPADAERVMSALSPVRPYQGRKS
jgi:hypothetical protein